MSSSTESLQAHPGPPQSPLPAASGAEPVRSPAQSLERFSLRQRIEHISVMSTFLLLSLTGFPQKYYAASWSQELVGLLGGVVAMRWIHRICGLVFSALVVVHLGAALWRVLQRKTRLSVIVPTRQDFRDAIQTLRYYLRGSKEHPRFDRFDYRQKFEYWGLVFGAVVMVITGFVLFFPMAATTFLPGQLIPASKVAHSNEGLMAFLVVILWHVYNAHLNPDVFPMDMTMFTGKISRERMEKEHPLELARLEAGQPRPPGTVEADQPRPPGTEGGSG